MLRGANEVEKRVTGPSARQQQRGNTSSQCPAACFSEELSQAYAMPPGGTCIRPSSWVPSAGSEDVGCLTVDRGPQGAKYPAPLIWQGRAIKNETETTVLSAVAAEAARSCQAVHSQGLFGPGFCPLYLLSHTLPFPRLTSMLSHMLVSSAWDSLFSSVPNESPWSLQGLGAKLSKSRKPSRFLPSHPQAALIFLDPPGGSQPPECPGTVSLCHNQILQRS